MTMEVRRGSVLEMGAEGIVNAANTAMRGGGGVDGAIHAAAGRELLRELERVAPNGARTVEIVVTEGYSTGAQKILHVAGPIWRGGGGGEEELLRRCYADATSRAIDLGLASLAFPSISTGIYGFPIDRAAPIAVSAVTEAAGKAKLKVVFAMYGELEYRVFMQALKAGSPAG